MSTAKLRSYRERYGKRLGRFGFPLSDDEAARVKAIQARLRRESRILVQVQIGNRIHLYGERVEFWLEERRAEAETRKQIAAPRTAETILAENPPEEKTYTSKAVPKRKRGAA